MLPISYLQYYFHRRRRLAALQAKALTRGEEVLALEKEIFAAYTDPAQCAKPEPLTRRGGGGYARVALGVIDAIHNNNGRVFVVNTLNRGATPYLPADAALEMPCVISAAGVRPLVIPDLPRAVWGLVAAVKNYEQLTVDAAISGDETTARLAMLAHPLVGDWELANRLFDDLFEANRAYLPQFCGAQTPAAG
jgi:6-phospho-beta-glucosidase